MSKVEVILEAGSEQALASLRRQVAGHLAEMAPGATLTIGPTEHLEGATSDLFSSVIWATLVAPILAGSVLFGIQKAFETKETEPDPHPIVIIQQIDQGIVIKTKDGEITVVPHGATTGANDPAP